MFKPMFKRMFKLTFVRTLRRLPSFGIALLVRPCAKGRSDERCHSVPPGPQDSNTLEIWVASAFVSDLWVI